jgi:hypothetical protein
MLRTARRVRNMVHANARRCAPRAHTIFYAEAGERFDEYLSHNIRAGGICPLCYVVAWVGEQRLGGTA